MNATSIDPGIQLSRALARLAAVALAAMALACAPRAFAACETGTPAEELAQHPLVFVATVTALHDSAGANGAPLRHAQLHVRSTWKGWPGRTLSVTLGDAKKKNAVALSLAETYVVYADSVGDAVWIPECGRTAPVALAGDDVKALGEPAPVAPLPRRRSGPH
jgi:hypothetical protein